MQCGKRPTFCDKYVDIFRKIPWKPQFTLSRLFLGNIPFLRQLQQLDDEKNPNDKLTKITVCLKELFLENPKSKVIIFVQRRKVAEYLTDILRSDKSRLFKASQFISTGNKEYDRGMSVLTALTQRQMNEVVKDNMLQTVM